MLLSSPNPRRAFVSHLFRWRSSVALPYGCDRPQVPVAPNADPSPERLALLTPYPDKLHYGELPNARSVDSSTVRRVRYAVRVTFHWQARSAGGACKVTASELTLR